MTLHLSVEAKRRTVLLHSCGKALLNIYLSLLLVWLWLLHALLFYVCVVYSKLHETCMFHAMRKRGPCKHVTGVHCRFLMAPHLDMHVTVKL